VITERWSTDHLADYPALCGLIERANGIPKGMPAAWGVRLTASGWMLDTTLTVKTSAYRTVGENLFACLRVVAILNGVTDTPLLPWLERLVQADNKEYARASRPHVATPILRIETYRSY
jgi:hypothetical protein